MGTQLAVNEMRKYEACKVVVSDMLRGVVDGGAALLAIRDEKLYRAEYRTFVDFLRQECKLTKTTAYAIINRARAVKSLPSNVRNSGQTPPILPQPETASHADELNKAPENRREEVWEQVIETAPKDADGKPKVTAAHVKKTVEASKPVIQDDGTPTLTDAVALIMDQAEAFNLIRKAMLTIRKEVEGLKTMPVGEFLDLQTFRTELNNAREVLKFSRPKGPCPYCGQKGCKACHDTGWLPEGLYKAAVAAMGGGDA